MVIHDEAATLPADPDAPTEDELAGFRNGPAAIRNLMLKLWGSDASVQIAAGRPTDQVHLVNWERPENNDFALAEEVTLRGGYERRPDVVLYLNGIAVGVIELKRSSVEIADGVRQLITNQEEIFNQGFFKSVVWDEIQELRHGTDSLKGNASMVLAKNAEFRQGLTATPIYNYGDEMWNIMSFIRCP